MVQKSTLRLKHKTQTFDLFLYNCTLRSDLTEKMAGLVYEFVDVPKKFSPNYEKGVMIKSIDKKILINQPIDGIPTQYIHVTLCLSFAVYSLRYVFNLTDYIHRLNLTLDLPAGSILTEKRPEPISQPKAPNLTLPKAPNLTQPKVPNLTQPKIVTPLPPPSGVPSGSGDFEILTQVLAELRQGSRNNQKPHQSVFI